MSAIWLVIRTTALTCLLMAFISSAWASIPPSNVAMHKQKQQSNKYVPMEAVKVNSVQCFIPPATTGILPATFSETLLAIAKRSLLVNWEQREATYKFVTTKTTYTLQSNPNVSECMHIIGTLTSNISLERHTVNIPETPDWMYHSVIARQKHPKSLVVLVLFM